MAEIVFDKAFLGGEEEHEAPGSQDDMLFAQLAREHGSTEILKDLANLGYHEVVVKRDGEPALRNVQEEVKCLREAPAILENAIVANSQAIGAAERAVQSVAEHVRVLCNGMDARLRIKVRGIHRLIAWLAEHVADTLSKYDVSIDG